MFKLDFSNSRNSSLRLLCVGAHSDDIEIGCGATVLRLLEEYSNIEVCWVVFGSGEQRGSEARESARLFLEEAKQKKIVILSFRDSFFPYIGTEIKEFFETLKHDFSPDLIFTHYRNDLHQDHRLISELTWNTFRDHFILEYEIVKYDGDLGAPNFFVHLDEDICQKKINIIMECFSTQGSRNWFTADAFLSILRLRGVESNAPQRYAEGFYCRKIVF